MKELKGKMTFLINRDVSRVEIKDVESGQILVKCEILPENLVRMMSREANIECDVKLFDTSNAGKKLEMGKFEFAIDKTQTYTGDELQKICQTLLDAGDDEWDDEGWVADNYFGSKDSFFYKGDLKLARATIRRWV